ncbi:MAG TPA: hypothetical protein VLL49_10655, partial [Anaerolineales bacterium]|nr:hypothetical protein [Anaerolineales bacterium]
MIRRIGLLLGACSLAVAACGPSAAAAEIDLQMTSAVQTAVADIVATQAASQPVPTQVHSATPAAPRTPPALPAMFTSAALNPQDTPHAYIEDQCQYLRDKWTSTHSVPGTIVLVIMFHSIEKGES